MSEAPLISIVILTYNNYPILRQCILSALNLDYPNREIIVVDNASTDNTAAQVREEFGDRVDLLVREKNSPTVARNEGYWRSRGEIVLSLDHDMIFEDTSIIQRAVKLFEEFPTVGVLSAKICGENDPDQPLKEHWWYPTPMRKGKDRQFFTSYFPEGTVFFRAETLRQTGGYDENFHHFQENRDLAMKILRSGWKIMYCPSLSSIELVVSPHVSTRRSEGNYYSLRNRLWFARKYYPLWRAFTYAVPRIILEGFRSIRYGWFDYFLAGLRDGLMAPQAIRDARQPLRFSEWAEIRRMEGVPALVSPKDGAERSTTPAA